jgi:hypothetical protein
LPSAEVYALALFSVQLNITDRSNCSGLKINDLRQFPEAYKAGIIK